MDATNEQRVRINMKATAAGLAQFDITSEFPTAEEAGKELRKAIDEFRATCKEKGIKIAGEA